MKDAVVTYLEVVSPSHGVVSESQLDFLAERLARLVPLYQMQEDGQGIRPVARGELRGGRFRAGGDEYVYADGRPPVRGLATTRAALDAVIALERARWSMV